MDTGAGQARLALTVPNARRCVLVNIVKSNNATRSIGITVAIRFPANPRSVAHRITAPVPAVLRTGRPSAVGNPARLTPL